jgi:defect-in-organelle-trafficking protein DotC
MFHRHKYLRYGLLTLSFSGCGFFSPSHYEVVGDTSTLEGLTKVHAVQKRTAVTSSTHLRMESIRDYAFSIGAQAGCAKHTRQLQHLLNTLDKSLDRVYNFNVWMLPHNILPPILLQAQQAVSLVDSRTMRIAGHTYHIYKDAKFVSIPPHWRSDYLLKDASHITANLPKSLVTDLLPKNQEEQKVWGKAIRAGWQCGIEQARNNFMANLHTLARELNGMVLYRQLLAKGMVSEPYVTYTDLGVTGDEHTVHVDDKVLKIVELPTLNHDSNAWQPIITNEEASHDRTFPTAT